MLECVDKRLLSVVGELNNNRVVFLVDSGASNNFLSYSDARRFGMKF